MFEAPGPKFSGLHLKVVLITGCLLGVSLGVVVYLNQSTQETLEPLRGVARAQDNDFLRYSPLIPIESNIKMGKSFSGKRTVIFAGAVTNNSERPLDVIEVKLTLFNANEPVFGTIRTPIRPGRYTPPIEPGETRGFTLYLEKFPRTWLASRAEITLNGLRLATVE